MNHDINHCKGDGCLCKETCLCYKAHLDLFKPVNINEPFWNWVSYTDVNVCIENNYFLYMKEKKYN